MISLIKRGGKHPTTKKQIYYPAWKKNQDVDSADLAELIASAGSMSAGMLSAAFTDFPKFIYSELLQGNQVIIKGLGVFKLKVRGHAKEDRDKVNTNDMTVDIIFEPDPVKLAAFRAACKFKFVKVDGSDEDDPSTNSSTGGNASTGDFIDDTSTGNDSSVGTIDTSTNEPTVDTSTGGDDGGNSTGDNAND